MSIFWKILNLIKFIPCLWNSKIPKEKWLMSFSITSLRIKRLLQLSPTTEQRLREATWHRTLWPPFSIDKMAAQIDQYNLIPVLFWNSSRDPNGYGVVRLNVWCRVSPIYKSQSMGTQIVYRDEAGKNRVRAIPDPCWTPPRITNSLVPRRQAVCVSHFEEVVRIILTESIHIMF